MAEKTEPARTAAWRAFEENLDSVAHIFGLLKSDIREWLRTRSRFMKTLARVRQSANEARPAQLNRAIKRIEKRLADLKGRLDRRHTAMLWLVVIVVTCVEAYLQDLLASAASISPDLISEFEKLTAPYPEVVAAVSVDELARDLRSKWARNWVANGGPTRWISRLKEMGARGYLPDLGPRLERYWGIRHVAVHAAGIATADFVRLHPGVVKAKGERVRLPADGFKDLLLAAKAFMEETDRYFLSRFPQLAAPSPEPKK